jgi:hypothetical protein
MDAMKVDVMPEIVPAASVEVIPVIKEMPQVRAMTRRQVKQMRAAGFNLLGIVVSAEEEPEKVEDLLEWILVNIYSDIDLDDFPNGDCMRLARDTLMLAVGNPTDEAKNS